MKILSILTLFLISCIFYSIDAGNTVSSGQWCSSCNDPHMRTSDGLAYEFQIPGKFYVMYTNYFDTRVTASFQKCNPNKNVPVCNCGVHVKYQGALLFLDSCGAIGANGLNFYYTSNANGATPTIAQCDSKFVLPGKETDDSWWNTDGNVVKVGNQFLCAKSKNQASTFFIRTNNPDSNKNIYVKVQLHCRGITCIFIRPAAADFGNTGGLCGNFSNNKGDDLFIWNCTGTPNGGINGGYSPVKATAQQMSQFWKLDRCAPDELDYKTLDKSICPCDRSQPGSNVDCAVPLSQCGPNSIGIKVNPSPCDCVHNKDAKPSERKECSSNCDAFFTRFKIDQALKAGLIAKEHHDNLREWCILDCIDTSDDYWTIHTVQIARNLVLENCGDSNPHALCQEFTTPVRCLIPDYISILNDNLPVESCPKRRCISK